MAISINGTTDVITYGDGSTQSGGFKCIGYNYHENSTRQVISGNSGDTDMWTISNAINRKNSGSFIRVSAILPGVDAYSYPYYHTYVGLNVNGTRVRKADGSHYASNYQGATHVYWFVEYDFTAGEIGSYVGNNISLFFGYGSSSGGGNKPWEYNWNPNSNDDSRAPQTVTQAHIQEFV